MVNLERGLGESAIGIREALAIAGALEAFIRV
jgi:hypothetical protein